MKKVLTKFMMLGGIGLLMLSACKKDGTLVKTDGGKSGALNASASTLALDKTKLNDPAQVMSFTFSQPDFGYKASVTNTLQIDKMGDNWAKPTSVTLGVQKNTVAYSTADFNTLLLKLNLTGGVASQVQVRVQHSIGGASTPIYSNVLTLTVTPFNLTSYLYAVGAFQGWNINNCDSLISATSNSVYTGIFYFPSGSPDFLVVPKKGSFDNKYATNDPVNTTTSNVTVGAPNNFFSPSGGGTYQVTLDLNTNKVSFATPAVYYSIIGDAANGWDAGNDIDMNYTNNGGTTWTATVALKAGGFKLRKNHDWAISYGLPAAADGTLTSDNGGNITVTAAGTYKITFLPPVDDKTNKIGTYTFVKQ